MQHRKDAEIAELQKSIENKDSEILNRHNTAKAAEETAQKLNEDIETLKVRSTSFI